LKTKKVGSSGRMGPRYGWKLRREVRDIDARVKGLYECAHCGKQGVSRVSTGIWKCSKCGSVFAGGAYSPRTTE
jgi:large subunit ribosomal protein L37Ae